MPSPKGRSQSPADVAEAPVALPEIRSPSLEVLESLEIQNAVSTLEARLDSLEIDIARQAGTREDDARRLAGEMAVMKARVEDAVQAFAGTADELRAMARVAEQRLEEIGRRSVGDDASGAELLRGELRAGIDGVMAGVGDVLESVATETRERIEELGRQMAEVQEGMIKVAAAVGGLAALPRRVADLESVVAKLLAADVKR